MTIKTNIYSAKMIEQLPSFIIIARIGHSLPPKFFWVLQILFAIIIVEFDFSKPENFVITFNTIVVK